MATVDGTELRQLVCNNAFEPRWESYTLDDLGPGEVRVRSELTAAKHGTEKGEITGESIYCSVPMDPDGRVFDRSRTHPYDPAAWKPVGNTTVGTVMTAGKDVEDLKEGDRVYGYGGFRTVHQGRHFKPLLPGFTEEAACCMDPADANWPCGTARPWRSIRRRSVISAWRPANGSNTARTSPSRPAGATTP